MGNILPGFKASIVNDLITNITSGTDSLYAFASNPVAVANGGVNAQHYGDYDMYFNTLWTMTMGKKLSNNDVKAMIVNNPWVNNQVYARYDNNSNVYAEAAGTYTNTNFYAVVPPGTYGGGYNIYICIDNNGNSNSTVTPTQVQPTTFQTSDGYLWRYITTVSAVDYTRFTSTTTPIATLDNTAVSVVGNYIPVYPNTTISSGAFVYSGVDVVSLINSGNGYISYHDGYVRGIVNSTVIQIESSSTDPLNPPSVDKDFYTNNGIYIYNTTTATSQYFGVAGYLSNTIGGVQVNQITLDAPANTFNITPGVTQYKISPKIVFQTDGTRDPVAYSVINTTSNSISNVVIIDPGSQITWANVTIQSNTSYPNTSSGTRASAYAIVPPPGGHGYNIYRELKVSAIGFAFNFANNESGNVVTTGTYNKIGIMKNPYASNLTTNSVATTITRGSLYTNAAFNQVLIANVTSQATAFTVGSQVSGITSGALGVVMFSNSTQIGIVGDKSFIQQETITDGTHTANLYYINTYGNIYAKDCDVLYTQNISDVVRSNSQTESYKLIIQV